MECANNARGIVLDADKIDSIPPQLEFVLSLGTKFIPFPHAPSSILKKVGSIVNKFAIWKRRLHWSTFFIYIF